MFIIGGVLLSLVTLQTKAMVSIAQAKERQQATAIANEVLERLRALPWEVVSRGTARNALDSALFVSGDKLTIEAENISGEILVQNADDESEVFINSPLNGEDGTNVTTYFDPTGINEFQAHVYVTAPQGSDGPLNLVVVVTWEANDRSMQRSVVAHTSTFNTESGCGADAIRPYVTACQDFYIASSVTTMPSITITGVDAVETPEDEATTPERSSILAGSPISVVSVSGASIAVNIDSAQATKVKATGTPGSFSISDISGEEVATSDLSNVLAEDTNAVGENAEAHKSASQPIATLFDERFVGTIGELHIQSSRRGSDVLADASAGCEIGRAHV